MLVVVTVPLLLLAVPLDFLLVVILLELDDMFFELLVVSFEDEFPLFPFTELAEDIIDSVNLELSLPPSTTNPDDEEIKLLDKTKNKKRIVIINKTDIGDIKTVEKIKKMIDCEPIEISVKTGEGTQKLIDEIKKLYNIGELSQNDGVIVTNMRQITALINAKDALARVQESIDCGMPSDIASIDLNLAIEALGEITGAVVSDDIVSAVFHDFCVGK